MNTEMTPVEYSHGVFFFVPTFYLIHESIGAYSKQSLVGVSAEGPKWDCGRYLVVNSK